MKAMTTSLVRGGLTLVLGAAIVAGGLLLGGVRQDLEAVGTGDPMRNYFTHEMPRFPGASESPLGRDLSFNGMPMEISYFQTGKGVGDVRDWYLAAFKKMSLATSVSGGDGGAVVYGTDTKARIQRIVSIQQRGDGTFVFPAIVPLLAIPVITAPTDGDLAVMDGATGLAQISSSDYGQQSRLVTWLHTAPPNEVVEAVRAKMVAQGWTADDSGASPIGTALRFVKEGREAVYTIFREGPKQPTSVLVTVSGGGVRR